MPELTTFASREPAAYIAGTQLPDGVTNSRDMLAAVNLAGWNVRLRPVESDARRQTESFEVIRDNPTDGGLDRLGIVGERYGIVQNEQAFAMFDDLSPTWEAGGSFKNGTLVYGQVSTDKEIVIDPAGAGDILRPKVVVSTTHNGSGALRIGRTVERLYCLNMFNAMMGNLQHAISLRHTLTISDRLKKIRLAWKQNDAYFAQVEAEAKALFERKCTDKEFFAMVDVLIGERPDDNVRGRETKWENSRELFSQAWRGQPNANIYGTRWGALQAMLEKNQWGRTIQKTDNGLDNFAAAGLGFDDQTNRFRQNALELVRA